MRYEHEAPGDMLHIDTKKLGPHRAAEPPGHRQPARLGRRRRLGVAVRGRRRPRPDRLHRTCTPTRRPQCGAVPARRRRATTPAWASRSSGCSPTTARPSAPSDFAQACQRTRHSSTGSPAPTGRRPTARPTLHPVSACASGPTASPTSTPTQRTQALDRLEASLQLAPPAPRHRRYRTHVQTQRQETTS